ncbi:hypothetical protein ACWDA3_59090 [Nonomuraea rubra]
MTKPAKSRRERRERRLLLAIQSLLMMLGFALLLGLTFSATLAWFKATLGHNTPEFFAYLGVLILALAPAAMVLQARDAWREGYRARKPILTAWTMIGLGFLAGWAAGANWGEILFRPVVLGLMLWMARPVDDPGEVPAEVPTEPDDPTIEAAGG